MRIHICAVGRLRAGPEAELTEDYLQRFTRTGRTLALGPAIVTEIDDRRATGSVAQSALLARAIPDDAKIIVLDERGQQLTSPEFSRLLARWRDGGAQDAAFMIGGADGLDASLRDRADYALSFGPMVWPHLLARAMLAEQLYRAATILTGGPYHRA